MQRLHLSAGDIEPGQGCPVPVPPVRRLGRDRRDRRSIRRPAEFPDVQIHIRKLARLATGDVDQPDAAEASAIFIENLVRSVVLLRRGVQDHRGNGRSVRRPGEFGNTGGEVRQIPGLANPTTQQIDLPGSTLCAVRAKGERIPVRRPARQIVAPRAEGDLPRLLAIVVDQPNATLCGWLAHLQRALGHYVGDGRTVS